MRYIFFKIKFVSYLIIHKWENEHKCRSVRDEESDSEKVRLWLCRTVEFVVEDELTLPDVRLLLLLLLFSIIFQILHISLMKKTNLK
jgi:hypothetical protein